MNEFSFIKNLLSPLTFGNGEALGLNDDAAIIPNKEGCELVITKDAMAEGTHFFKGDDPYILAKKILRVNISDLAAKGATPYCCFLALTLPNNTDNIWLEKFSEGLKEDLSRFNCFLAGGDTTSHNGRLVISLTTLGHIAAGKAILRSGAKENDLIYTTGTIGDSYLGLNILQGNFSYLPQKAKDFVISRYHLPQPRIEAAKELANIATSSIDISDGLIADLQHICDCSGIGAEITLDNIPFSDAAEEISEDSNFKLKAITGGDDYELLFTTTPNMEAKIKLISKQTKTKITKIGKITNGNTVTLLDKNKNIIPVINSGYQHKLGR